MRILSLQAATPRKRRTGNMEKLALGMLIGAIGGALAVTNSYKMRTLVKKGQEEVMTKVNTMMDEKLDKMQNANDNA
jgi:hypothetical protein